MQYSTVVMYLAAVCSALSPYLFAAASCRPGSCRRAAHTIGCLYLHMWPGIGQLDIDTVDVVEKKVRPGDYLDQFTSYLTALRSAQPLLQFTSTL